MWRRLCTYFCPIPRVTMNVVPHTGEPHKVSVHLRMPHRRAQDSPAHRAHTCLTVPPAAFSFTHRAMDYHARLKRPHARRTPLHPPPHPPLVPARPSHAPGPSELAMQCDAVCCVLSMLYKNPSAHYVMCLLRASGPGMMLPAKMSARLLSGKPRNRSSGRHSASMGAIPRLSRLASGRNPARELHPATSTRVSPSGQTAPTL